MLTLINLLTVGVGSEIKEEARTASHFDSNPLTGCRAPVPLVLCQQELVLPIHSVGFGMEYLGFFWCHLAIIATLLSPKEVKAANPINDTLETYYKGKQELVRCTPSRMQKHSLCKVWCNSLWEKTFGTKSDSVS